MAVLALILSGCGYKDYAEAVRGSNEAAAAAGAAKDVRLAELAVAAGESGNGAALVAIGVMIGASSAKNSGVQRVEAPAQGPEYIRALAPLANVGGLATVAVSGFNALGAAMENAGGNTSVGGDYVGGDENIDMLAPEEESTEIEVE